MFSYKKIRFTYFFVPSMIEVESGSRILHQSKFCPLCVKANIPVIIIAWCARWQSSPPPLRYGTTPLGGMNGVDRNAAPLLSRRCGSKAGSATYRRRDAVAAKSGAFWFGARGPCEGGGGVQGGGGYMGAARKAAADDAAVRQEAGPSRRLCRRLLALSICATLVNNIRLVYFKVMCYNVFIGETSCT